MEFIVLSCCISACLIVGRVFDHKEEMARIERGVETPEPEAEFSIQIGDDK